MINFRNHFSERELGTAEPGYGKAAGEVWDK
jgi:hypothetical protein